VYHGKQRRKGFTETGYAQLLDAAHRQLGGPLVVVWDNLGRPHRPARRQQRPGLVQQATRVVTGKSGPGH